jgi:hypothetical protein
MQKLIIIHTLQNEFEALCGEKWLKQDVTLVSHTQMTSFVAMKVALGRFEQALEFLVEIVLFFFYKSKYFIKTVLRRIL